MPPDDTARYPRLTAKDLRNILVDWADRATVDRGLPYAKQGVSHIDRIAWESDSQLHLFGLVNGSAPRPYQVDVALDPYDDSLGELIGNCTCPVAYDCKHAVALLWLWAENAGVLVAEASPPAPIGPRTPNVPAAVLRPRFFPTAVDEWLQRTYTHTETRAPDPTAPPASAERVAYSIDTHGVMSVVKVRVNKSGEVKRSAQSASLAWIRHDHRMPAYIAEDDEPVLRLLESAQERASFSPTLRLAGKTGRQLLDMALATQRVWFAEREDAALVKPLKWGAARSGTLAWAPLDGDDTSPLRLTLKDVQGNSLAIIPTQPPVAVDYERGEIVPFETPLTAGTLERLVSLPPLAAADLEAWRFARDAWMRFPDAHRIPVLPMGLDPLPIPNGVLRFALAEITSTAGWGRNAREMVNVVPAVELTMHYPDGRRVTPASGASVAPIEDELDAGKVVGSHVRNVWVERTWVLKMPARLRPLVEVEPALMYAPQKVGKHGLWALPRHAWSTDGPRVLADAQAAGFKLEIDAGFPLTLEDIPEPELELVRASENGWYRFALGVDIGGKRVDLAPAFARLIGGQRDPEAWVNALTAEDRVLLSLEDGKVVRLAGDRVRALLEPVLAWFQGGAVDAISSLQAALLPQLVVYRGRDVDAWTRMRDKLKAGHSLRAVAPAPGFIATLRPYQESGLAWLAHMNEIGMGGVLADDMGLGKTVQTLAHLHREHTERGAKKPSLIVAPTSVVPNWHSEARKFAPQLRVHMHHGKDRALTAKALANADVVITSYPILQRDEASMKLLEWNVVVFDEAQVLKNAKAKTHHAAQTLKSTQRLALTGTPMENHLGELWAQFNVLVPGLLGDLDTFNKHFRHRIEQNADTERMKVLRQRIRPFLLRRTRDEVLKELPLKTEATRWIELEPGQADLYESLRTAIHDDVRKVIDKKGLKQSTIHILDALLKLRQACCDPRLVKVPGKRSTANLPSAKLEWLMEHVPMLVDEGRRVLIFSQFTSMLALIQQAFDAEGVRYVTLTGDTDDRATPIAQFQDGEVPVFLLSLKAGGVGLNLTAADTVIHYDPWWNPAVEAQATARAHRIGQDKPVFVYKLIAKGTLEEKMLGLLERKTQLAAALLDGGGGALAGLTAADVDDLLAPIEAIVPIEK